MFGANKGDEVCSPEEAIDLMEKRMIEVKK